jgi:hypothetical protein
VARLLAAKVVEIVALDDPTARAVGQLCGVAGALDVVDASVVLRARQRGHKVVTNDPDDLLRMDPSIELVAV